MNDTLTFQCPECGLHYEDEEKMKQCQQFCSENKACNLEITKYSIERKDAEV